MDPKHGTSRVFGPADGLPMESVERLLLHQGGLWAATRGGLFRGEPFGGSMRFSHVPLPLGDPNEILFGGSTDREGRLWIAGSRGLAVLEQGRWTRLTTADGLRTNYTAYVAQAADGAIWLGYREASGLSRMVRDGGRWKPRHFSAADGLQSEQALFVGADARGRIWFGTDRGVDVYESGQWRHFGTAHGLVWNDCNGNAFFADADGSVWIGTSKGLSHYRVPDAAAPAAPTPATLTMASAGGRALPLVGASKAPWAARSFHATFAALTFIDESAVAFRHRMAGLEDAWTVTERGEARYPELPPGQYTFEVEARNAAGVWSAAPAALAIAVAPPWWRTVWFLLLAAGAMGALAWAAWRARVRHIMQVQRRLESAVEERTRDIVTQKAEIERLLRDAQEATRLKSQFLANVSHEIRTPMNGIVGMADLVLDTPLDAEQEEYLRLLKLSADSLLTIINDILDFSKIEAGRLDLEQVTFEPRAALDDTLRTFVLPARQKGLRLEWSVAEDVPGWLVGDPDRLRQVLVNLVGNALKFTTQGRVGVDVDVFRGAGHGHRHSPG
jgi:signal transduction histidine kinase